MSLTLSSYSHGHFFVTGKSYHVDFATLSADMRRIWGEVKNENFMTRITDTEYPSLHAVYFNHSEAGFDMLIGLITKEGSVQKNTDLITIVIPAQDYRYGEFEYV